MDYLKHLIRFFLSRVVSKPTVPAYVMIRPVRIERRIEYRR